MKEEGKWGREGEGGGGEREAGRLWGTLIARGLPLDGQQRPTRNAKQLHFNMVNDHGQ